MLSPELENVISRKTNAQHVKRREDGEKKTTRWGEEDDTKLRTARKDAMARRLRRDSKGTAPSTRLREREKPRRLHNN
jgi:hypothetical protein